MKKFTFKGVLDGFRSSVQPQNIKPEQEIQETLRSEYFTVKKTFRHGFPHSPTAIAYDPIQRLLVIGDKAGSLRILGSPGVDTHVRHEGESACTVIQMVFLVNEGALVTATADDTLHLWNFRQKCPQIVQSLKFQREKITCLHLPVGSKWLYIGTDKGNIHVVNIETFTLSGYIINWNKAMEITRSTRPGSVVGLCDSPIDANKLLIAYDSGQIVLWDLRGKFGEMRWQSAEPLKSVAWHHEGKHFVSSHTDGSLCTWPLRPSPKPQIHSFPHAKTNKDGKLEACKPIHKVDLRTAKTGETFTMFSGGLSMEKGGKSPCITVLQGRSTTVLEMEHPVVDFVTLCESPWPSEMQDPYAIAVLLQNDLVLIDLLTPGFPCFESPYPMDLHESPVTCCTYLADCPSELVPAFYSAGRSSSSRKTGFSEREWPVSGGEWSPSSCSYTEIVITGHQDGSVKFWDAGAGTLQILYKMKTAKIFEKPKARSVDSSDDDPLAVQIITLCAESRRLCIAGSSGHVILFKFRKNECTSETSVIEVPISYENFDEGEGGSPECDFIPKQTPTTSDKNDGMLKVKSGPQKKPSGFQPQLICLTPWSNGSHPGQITSLNINSSYGVFAYGTEYGLAVIDMIQKVCLLNIASPDLYGAQDPYSRVPKSPKREDQARSPSIDQLQDLSCSPQKTSPLPSSIPQETITDASAAITGASSRPVSPATEALETPTSEDAPQLPVEEEVPQGRRKSIPWKSFNLKRQLSKVNMIKSKNNETVATAKKGSTFYCAPTEGTPLSPVEISPDTPNSESLQSEPSDPEKGDYLEQIEKDIESALDEMNIRTEITIESFRSPSTSDLSDTESPTVSTINMAQSMPKSSIHEQMMKGRGRKERTMSLSQPQANYNIEEPIITKSCVAPVEGAFQSRPSDLPLYDANNEQQQQQQPVPPPRYKKKDKRDQRLLSVPNIKYPVCDLRSKSGGKFEQQQQPSQQTQQSFAGNLMRRFSRADKLDTSFSRSRSSSMSSLENITSEAVTCLAFSDSYTKKSDPLTSTPTLWVGTRLGSVLTVSLSLPDTDLRKAMKEKVLVSIFGGPIFRLKGSILCMSFLDCNGALIPYTSEPWKATEREKTPTKNPNRMSPTLSGTASSSSSGIASGGPGSVTSTPGPSGAATTASSSAAACALSECIGDRQFIVMASEKQARVVALPSQNCVYRLQITESDTVVKAEIITMRESVCLVAYLSNGHLMAYSLPSLRPLLDIDFLPLIDLRISKAFCFSNKGHGLYLATPTELQKFTLCADFCQFTNEMMGELFVAHEMPEPPKENFFKGLFGVGRQTLDREELFGEQAGKANRSVAKHIPGPSVEQVGQRASTAASEISRAHQLAMERGEKLNQLEERAERMSNTAQEFSGTAHQLMLRYKDKKWYQL